MERTEAKKLALREAVELCTRGYQADVTLVANDIYLWLIGETAHLKEPIGAVVRVIPVAETD